MGEASLERPVQRLWQADGCEGMKEIWREILREDGSSSLYTKQWTYGQAVTRVSFNGSFPLSSIASTKGCPNWRREEGVPHTIKSTNSRLVEADPLPRSPAATVARVSYGERLSKWARKGLVLHFPCRTAVLSEMTSRKRTERRGSVGVRDEGMSLPNMPPRENSPRVTAVRQSKPADSQ